MDNSAGHAPEQTVIDFRTQLANLAYPAAFPGGIAGDKPVEVIHTHASAVLLAGDRAYKLKKPLDLGFLDYTTPALRHHFCELEATLNARLAPGIYLGVAPVIVGPDHHARFGELCLPGSVPAPGMMFSGGRIVDYAVVMKRLPEDATLESHVAHGTITPELVRQVARRIAGFHAAAATSPAIAIFGGMDTILGNWDENFAQAQHALGRTLRRDDQDQIIAFVRTFTQSRTALFARRVRDGRIRDCHGDLRLQHIYALGPSGDPGSQLAILDCIEFNERFRYGDVASEVAFVTMGFDAAGRPDLAATFRDAYVEATGDDSLPEILPFYACYRAYVRGKVLSFQMDEPEVPTPQRQIARRQAASLFGLAAQYASAPPRPLLVLVGGLMGTGKSTLADSLRRELGWVVLSSDAVRKRLAGVSESQPIAAHFEEGIYTPAWTRRTYDALLQAAGEVLVDGRSVLLDATFSRRDDRLAALALATRYGADVAFVECACAKEVALARLRRRWSERAESGRLIAPVTSAASDGRPELYDEQQARWEPYDERIETGLRHLLISTEAPVEACLAQILDRLHIPYPSCPLPPPLGITPR